MTLRQVRALRHVQSVDEQLVETEPEDQHHRAEEESVDVAGDAGEDRVTQSPAGRFIRAYVASEVDEQPDRV